MTTADNNLVPKYNEEKGNEIFPVKTPLERLTAIENKFEILALDVKNIQIEQARTTQHLSNIQENFKIESENVKERFNGVNQRFEQVNQRFDQVDKRIDQVDKRIDQVDKRFEQVDKRFEQVDKRLKEMNNETNQNFSEVKQAINKLDEKFESRLENKFCTWKKEMITTITISCTIIGVIVSLFNFYIVH
ncbi:hypothetical protein [Staphylococcus simulans]|uniref:hypothetical protein n=1 Tax=Staphylococcus simulans TaxID=1286 RepID=UPI001BCB24CD|nr:hypothetical protein [Staphylococcus simulans]